MSFKKKKKRRSQNKFLKCDSSRKDGDIMGCMNEEEQEDEILALSEILPPSTLTVERLGPASHSGTLQVL